MKKDEFMTGYETRVVHGYKKSAGDLLKDKTMLRNAVRNRLANIERTETTEEGEVVSISAIDLLVDAKFKFDLENPEKADLTKWLKVAGEDVNQSEISVRSADELFGDIVIKTK